MYHMSVKSNENFSRQLVNACGTSSTFQPRRGLNLFIDSRKIQPTHWDTKNHQNGLNAVTVKPRLARQSEKNIYKRIFQGNQKWFSMKLFKK